MKEYYIFSNEKFLIQDDYLYMTLGAYRTTARSAVMARYLYKGDTIIFDKLLDFKVPDNYIRYNIGTHMRTCYMDNDLFTFQLSERVYDISSGKTYVLPLPSETYESLSTLENKIKDFFSKGSQFTNSNMFNINGIKDLGASFKVMYRDAAKKQYSITVDKQSGKLLTAKLISENTELKNYAGYHPTNPNQIIRVEYTHPRCYFIENE